MLVVTDELKIEELGNALLVTIRTLVNSSILSTTNIKHLSSQTDVETLNFNCCITLLFKLIPGSQTIIISIVKEGTGKTRNDSTIAFEQACWAC